MPLDYAYTGDHIHCPSCQADLSTTPAGSPCPRCGKAVDFANALLRLNGLPKAFLTRFFVGILLRIFVLVWWAIGALETFAPSRWTVVRFLEQWAEEVWVIIALIDLVACLLIASRTGTFLDKKTDWLRKLLWMSSAAAVMVAAIPAAQTLGLIAPLRLSFIWPYVASNVVEIPRAIAFFFLLWKFMRLDGAAHLGTHMFWLTWAFVLLLQLYTAVWVWAMLGFVDWPSLDFDFAMDGVCLLELPIDAWAIVVLSLAAIRTGQALRSED